MKEALRMSAHLREEARKLRLTATRLMVEHNLLRECALKIDTGVSIDEVEAYYKVNTKEEGRVIPVIFNKRGE